MCKLAIISGIKDENRDAAWAFVKQMSIQMSAPNSPENDGVGYAAIDDQGKLFGERWFNNKDAFQHDNVYGSPLNDSLVKKFKIVSLPKVYNNFGTFNQNIRSITLHSRLSTNSKELRNNHPFVEGFTSVIHNGVIYNDDKLTKKTSTCDSEVILHEYLKLNVRNKSYKVKKLANRLEGYYAMGIFSRTDSGQVILDVLRDDQAKLKAYFIKELDTVVFATPKHFGKSAVEEACAALGFEIVSEMEVKSNKLQRFDAMTGETIGFESFKPKKQFMVQSTKKFTNYSEPSYTGYNTYQSEDEYDRMYSAVKDRTTNVFPFKSHSSEKHLQAALERDLEDILISSKEYTEEELKELSVKYLPEVIEKLSNFNDDGGGSWTMDERFVWHRKEG